jgi:hypothetical protein
MVQIDWGLAASWAQAISNTVVLFLIYLQMRQVNSQMVQNDDQERYRRSWEFVKLYREELRQSEHDLVPLKDQFQVNATDPSSDLFKTLFEEFFKPRMHLFVLLNQLVHHQEVDERVLFGYLESDFNLFVELGIIRHGAAEFRKLIGSRIDILITLWGSQIKSSQLLYKA